MIPTMNPQYMMPHQTLQGYGGQPGGQYPPMRPEPDGNFVPGSQPPTSVQNGPAPPRPMQPQMKQPQSFQQYGAPQIPNQNGMYGMKPGSAPSQYPPSTMGPPRLDGQHAMPPQPGGGLYTQPPRTSAAPPRQPPPPSSSLPGQLAHQMGAVNLGGMPPKQQQPPPPPQAATSPPGMGMAIGQLPMGMAPSQPPMGMAPNQPPMGMVSGQPPMGMAPGQPPRPQYPPQSQSGHAPTYPTVSSPPMAHPPPPTQPGMYGAPPVSAASQAAQYTMYGGGGDQWQQPSSHPPGMGGPLPSMGQPGMAIDAVSQASFGSVNGLPTGQGYNMAPDNMHMSATAGGMKNRYPASPMGQGGQVPPASPPGAPPGHHIPPLNNMPQPLQTQQPRRLDPDQMPSPIQVIEDDKKNRGDVFCTGAKGQIPPLVTTNFVTRDEGNCNPRFMRSTMYSVPANPDMLKQTGVPFAVVISPFARLHPQEFPPPIVNMGDLGPVRCVRCKAYMCPFMQFMDGGRRFQCGFCKGTTEVPPEYFAHLDHTGQRVDKFDRPELCLGSFEYVAIKDYCKNNVFPKTPAFIFLLDVSYNSVKNGMVNLLCENMKQILSVLPREGETSVKVGFVTYSNTVQFYNVKSCLAQPQMMVVSDVHDMFMPLLDGFLVDVNESEAVIDSLMEQIPEMFKDSRETETILGPAIQAGLEALKASDCAGKLLVFHASLPIADAPGKLKNRDDRKLLGTDKEKTLLTPQSNFYTQLGQDCVTAGCSVDLFTFPNAYIDIATIGQVSRLSGGQLHKYTYFQADVDGHRLLEDLKRTVERPIAFDAIMRVRTSTGVRPTDFFGSYYMSNTTDVELAAVDGDKAITVEIKHDDKLTEEDSVFIQTAVLYTSIGGQRRLRIHNLSLNTCTQMADLYRNCELDAIINYLSKASLRQLMDQNPKAVKDHVTTRCAQILACYRKNCASPSLAGQLILPECMKLLPLYANCMLKSDALNGGSELLTDDRSFMMMAVSSMDISSSVGYIYPRLLPLHDVDVDSDTMPVALRCTMEKLQDNGVYLLENGIYMFMWIGMNVPSEWVQNVFSVQSAAQIDIDKTKLLELDSPLSHRVRNIVHTVQEERQRYMRLTIVRQRDKLEMVFRHFLVEDKGSDNSSSYVDYLCHLHKEIRSLLS